MTLVAAGSGKITVGAPSRTALTWIKLGSGDIDFADMFRRIEGKGFTGHYTNAFGSLDEEGIGLLRNQGERVAVRRSKDLARRRATQRERSLAILTQGAASRCVRGTTSR